MGDFKKIPTAVLKHITDVHNERNVYVHPNPLARAIFWQRLVAGHAMLRRHATKSTKVLDYGGGSGTFLPTLAERFYEVSVLDLQLDDARRIASYYTLENIRFYQCDAAHWSSTELYDLVIAMDVLEHFADKSVPPRFLDRHLKRNGLLLVSLPTENFLYRLGRAVVGKEKPVDHYYPADELVRYYRDAGYVLLERRYVPYFTMLALPLFYVGLFRKLT